MLVGNLIGVAPDGSTAVADPGGHGIEIYDQAAGNRIGGSADGKGNVIANSAGDGIAVLGDAGSGNAYRGNSIYDNAGLGINVVGGTEDGSGVTANDPGDGIQNYPELTAADVDGTAIAIDGSVYAPSNTTLTLDFYASPDQDPSGHGERKIHLGSETVITDGSGNATFSVSFSQVVAPGSFITATDANTSEFSAALEAKAVNDAPAGSDGTVTATEDTDYVFSAADFGFSDPKDHGDHALFAVKISSLPAAGLLKLNGTAVSSGQFVSKDDIDADKLVFTPAANDNGTGYANLTFQVQDDGRTANGGQDLDQTPNTMTIDVNAVNDDPVVNDDSFATDEDETVSGSVADLLANDTDVDGDTPTITSYTQPANGTLTDNGDGTWPYTPDPDFNGAESFIYTVSDGNGGTDTATVTITVNKTADGATVSGEDTGTVTEDDDPDTDGQLETTGTLTVTDPDAGEARFNAETVTGSYGDLTITESGDWSYSAANSQAAIQQLGAGKTLTDTLTVTTADATTHEVTITIQGVNDAPTSADNTVTTAEDTPYTFTATDFAFAGLDAGESLQGIRIADRPEAGRLELDGAMVSAGDVIAAADIAAGKLKFVPDADDNGNEYAQFEFEVNDGNAYSLARTMTVDVTPVNDTPLANDTSVSVAEGESVVLDLLGAAADVDGDSLEVTVVSGPEHGTLVRNPDGTVSYVSSVGYSGDDAFAYRIDDGQGGIDTAMVAIEVTPAPPDVPEPPPPSPETEAPEPTPPAEMGVDPGLEPSRDADTEDSMDRDRGSHGSSPSGGGESAAAPDGKKAAPIAPLPLEGPDNNEAAPQPFSSDVLESLLSVLRDVNGGSSDGEAGLRDVPRLSGAQASEAVGEPPVALDRALATLQRDLDDAAKAEQPSPATIMTVASNGASVSLAAGFVAWLLRGGSLVASLVSSLPVWKGMDPLPVLLAPAKRGDKAEGEDEENCGLAPSNTRATPPCRLHETQGE